MTYLIDMPPGSTFRLPFSGITGTLVRIGPGSAVVRYGSRTVQLTAQEIDGDRAVAFESPGRPVTVSLYTEVEEEVAS